MASIRVGVCERYSPYGTPERVAEFLTPYIDAGCSKFNVIQCAADQETPVGAVGELRELLNRGVVEPAALPDEHQQPPSDRD